MLTKAEIKNIQALSGAQERKRQGLFVCEGYKLIADMLPAYNCCMLVATEIALNRLRDRVPDYDRWLSSTRIELVAPSFDFKRLSSLTTPPPVLALFKCPPTDNLIAPPEGLSLLLDGVQDPGNVGTIIRTADWFGVRQVYLTASSADPFSAKVLQASMGAMQRVRVHRLDNSLDLLLQAFEGRILGAYLDGESIYTAQIEQEGRAMLLVLGNEGQGISPELSRWVNRRITIPPYDSHTGCESLNVAIAAALCLNELRRK